MKLNISIVVNSIKTPCEYIVGEPNFPLTLSGICPYLQSSSVLSDDMLYIAHWFRFSGAQLLPKYIICIGGGKEAADFFENHDICAAIYPEDSTTLLSDISHLFTHYNDLERNLYNVLIGDSSTKVILNCCSEFFKAHVTLYNSELSLIDYSDKYSPAPEEPNWNGIISSKRSTLPPIPRDKATVFYGFSLDHPKSIFLNVDKIPPHYIIPFYYGHARFAMMIITETETKLSDSLHWLVDYVADAIYPVISRRYNSSKDTRNFIRNVIAKTLQDKTTNEELVRNSLAKLDWKEDDDYQLLIISLPQDSRNISSFLYNYEHIFADAESDCIATFFDDFIVVLLHNITLSQIESFTPILENQLLSDNGICSFGMPFCNFSQLPTQYELAVTPIISYPSNKPIMNYREIMAKHLIGELSTTYPIECVCHKAAVKIHEYDKQNGTNYLLTLETYLLYNKSLMAASEKLFIHRSTMTYRLKCIEKIAEMKFDDPSERLSILLSCIVLRVLFENE